MSFQSVVTALSPYAWYRCNEASGTTLTDASGNSRDGTIAGTVTYQNTGFTSDGNHAIGIPLNGGTVGLDLPASSGFPGVANAAFTLGFIWKPGAFPVNNTIASSQTGGSSNFWKLNIAGSGQSATLQLIVNNNVVGNQPTLASIGVAQNGGVFMGWITYDGSGNWNVFINGSSSPVLSASSAPISISGSSFTFVVSAYNNNGTAGSAVGLFQDIILFNSVLSSSNRSSVFVASAMTAVLSGGTTTASNLASTVSLSWTGASGGTAPYTYTLYRGTSISQSISGQTLIYTGSTASFVDTPPSSNTTYWYTVVVNDSVGSAPIQYVAVPGQTGPRILICEIGDSRTFGVNAGTNADVGSLLAYELSSAMGNAQVTVSNQGVSGSNTSQWVSGSSNLNTALASFNTAASALPAGAKVYVQIALGVNDAQIATSSSAATVSANLTSTINAIKAANIPHFSGIVLHQNFYVVPYLYPQLPQPFTEISDQLIVQYNAAIAALADGVNVFLGETSSYSYFAANSASLLSQDGVHPNSKGYAAWAYFMCNAYLKLFGLAPGGSAPGSGGSFPNPPQLFPAFKL